MIRNKNQIRTQFLSDESWHCRPDSKFSGDIISSADHTLAADCTGLVRQPRFLQDFTSYIEHVHVEAHPNSTPATNFFYFTIRILSLAKLNQFYFLFSVIHLNHISLQFPSFIPLNFIYVLSSFTHKINILYFQSFLLLSILFSVYLLTPFLLYFLYINTMVFHFNFSFI